MTPGPGRYTVGRRRLRTASPNAVVEDRIDYGKVVDAGAALLSVDVHAAPGRVPGDDAVDDRGRARRTSLSGIIVDAAAVNAGRVADDRAIGRESCPQID